MIRTMAAGLAIGALSGAIPAWSADIYVNGKVYTADTALENATAFVVDDGVFVYVGDDEGALARRKEGDAVTDLGGARVLPGFIESHTHMTSCGAAAPAEDSLYCDGFKTRELLFEKGKEFAERRKDLASLGLREVPQDFSGLTMKDWDEICSDRPLFILFEGGHAGAVNTMMAEKIDLEHQKDPVPGVSYVARDADGHATGYMAELILTHMMCAKGTPLEKNRALQGIERMVHFYNSMGYTGITEGGTPNLNENEILPILKELDDAGKYTLHNDFASIWFGHNICSAEELENRIKFQKANFETDNIKIGTIKMWADGVLGAHSALMRERYNEPSGATNYGSRLSTMEDQLIATRLCKKNGWNMHIHAIGDKCVDDALDVYEMAGDMEGVRSLTHFEICDEDLMDRAAKMGIPVAVTPWWCTTQQASELEGAGRKVDRMIDLAGMVERGIRISFGSDSNGSPGFWNPIVNIYVAVARDPDAPADGAWLPGRPITIQQAIDASCINAAKDRGHGDEFGSISVGKSADFVIWNKDLMAIEPDEMLTYHKENSSFDMHVWPLKTFFRGKCVFEREPAAATCEKMWDGETVEHKGFRDLGNYVIELPDFTDPATLERGLAAGNLMADHGPRLSGGCTAMATRNSKGEVVTGRNMDLDISQTPAYVFKTTFGKYRNVCVAYSPGFYKPYAEIQKLDELDPTVRDTIPYAACDCLNEKGLYIEVNLREKNEKFVCYGLHSAHGEKTRADGKPWSELRASTTCVPQLVSQNCATVQEAVEFLKNSYDWYTITPAPGVNLPVSLNNMCFLVADATGEYGLIEIAQDEVSYIPYQYGHANFYITPKWNALETYGSGQGRLQMVSKVIGNVETLEEAMDAMKPIMWRNELMWLGNSERVTDGTRLHQYDQIVFQDDKGNPQLDWRGDYHMTWPVMDDGRMLVAADLYEQAVKSTYDPKIKAYFDAGIATGRMVVDDGSFTFDVGGKQVPLAELAAKYAEYGSCADLAKRAELKPYYDEYWRLITNESSAWVHDDRNFEALKAAAYANLHIRYDAEGKFDPSAMSKYQKLAAFYGHGVEKDEKPLRDDASIWTTSLNVGVNCARKEMKIRFWENDELIYSVKW